ncbi:MAG: peptide chain release factor 2 [Actinobacteria bacterium]|nr:peptide chain release factor 2 [Actinomycetota bacterium]
MAEKTETTTRDVIESHQEQLDSFREKLAWVKDYFDPEQLSGRLAGLAEQMHEPAFWDDAAAAQSVSSQYSRLKNRLDDYHELATQIDDLEVFLELANEEAVAGESPVEAMQDFERVAHSVQRTLDRFEEQRLFSGEFDAGDAVVSIHPGAGGTESQDWAEMLLRMYLRWAQGRGFVVEIKEATEGDEAGLKSATFTVHGENAYGLLSAERGVHRLVRISPFDSAARRHTSFASLDVSPLVEDDVAVDIDDKDLRVETYRSSGAGGQHVNKTDSAVRITHLPTKTVVQCQNERSQIQNRETAMRMLRSKLLQLEYERRQQGMAREKGEQKEIAWGSQIRSYVLAPYTLVKDHRTNLERGNVEGVLNGAIDDFIREYLVQRATGKLGKREV